MLERVFLADLDLSGYEANTDLGQLEELRELARPLQGMRILHVNATPYGGGVAEILRSEVPLLRSLGLVAEWQLIRGDNRFFAVTKAMHNGLQGADGPLAERDQDEYREHSRANGANLDADHDIIFIHDPQPLGLRAYSGATEARWVWRCHIDTSDPNLSVWNFLQGFLDGYDAAVFTMDAFVPPDLSVPRIVTIPPAIDPQSPKNMRINGDLGERLLRWIGVDPDRPLFTQVSRFDKWKDPLGVIACFRLLRQEVDGAQLAMVGSMAMDDPEAWSIYRQLQRVAHREPDVHVFTNLTGVGNVEVNAFQRHSDVVIQKSIREGFGLVVSETIWKGTPVVAGAAGGIPMQMPEGMGGFLVDSVEQCAEKALWLLEHPDEGRAIAERGREHVRTHFLLPRLIADELRLCRELLGV